MWVSNWMCVFVYVRGGWLERLFLFERQCVLACIYVCFEIKFTEILFVNVHVNYEAAKEQILSISINIWVSRAGRNFSVAGFMPSGTSFLFTTWFQNSPRLTFGVDLISTEMRTTVDLIVWPPRSPKFRVLFLE